MKVLNFIFLVLMVFLINCSSIKKINILTDDYNLLNIVDKFNSGNNIKANIDYISSKRLSDKNYDNLFKYAIENKLYNYDIIIGSNNSQTVIDSSRFCNLKSYINFIKKKNGNAFDFVYDYLDKNDYLSLPYRIDFPVILAEEKSLNDKNAYVISVDGITNLFYDNKYFNNNLYLFKFLPVMTSLKEIEYYFIFNSEITNINNKFNFSSLQTKKTFEFYNKFYETNKIDKKEAAEYIQRNTKINRDFYLKHKIINIDITLLSKALPNINKYKMIFFKDLKNCGLNNHTAAIQKSSVNKRDSSAFIDFLMDYNIQKLLYERSLSDQISESKFIPVYKNIINSEKLNVNKDFNFDDYINGLKSVNFFNNKLKRKFFNNYNSLKEKLNNGIINDSKFLEYFSDELNK